VRPRPGVLAEPFAEAGGRLEGHTEPGADVVPVQDQFERAARHEVGRAAGFDDRAILQINLIASWFNYINRVADGLGVGRDSS
jgi:hypothetical protein